MAAPNAELAYRVLDAVNANPANFDMDTWVRVSPDHNTVGLEQLTGPACGTTACFAGWTVALSGYEMTRDREVVKANRMVSPSVGAFAAELLGLDDDVRDDLFCADSQDFGEELVAEIFGPRPGGDL
jgi:hypothetical protein